MTAPLTVGILIFDDVEVLDFAGPFEVFSATRAIGGGDLDPQLFHVVTIAETDAPIHTRGNLIVQPHHTIADHPALDILVVPGGYGTRALIRNERVLAWVAAQAATVQITTSVCTGAGVLGTLGLLDGHRATTHWTAFGWLRELAPNATLTEGVRFVDEGSLLTSAGISAGIDMSLHLVARIHGQAIAEQTAREMEYDWRP